MLSGAIWKGAKLRVGEARPIWTERMALEREKQSAALRDEAARQQERHKKWLRKHPWIGVQAPSMEPVDRERVEQGEWVRATLVYDRADPQGWKVTPTGHLVRPMHMRPLRPVPRPDDARGPKTASHSVAVRASRLTLDPTRYANVHLTDKLLGAGDAEAQGVWECQETDEPGSVVWLCRDAEGRVIHGETVPLRQRVVDEQAQRDALTLRKQVQSDWDAEQKSMRHHTQASQAVPAEDAAAGDDLWGGDSAWDQGAGDDLWGGQDQRAPSQQDAGLWTSDEESESEEASESEEGESEEASESEEDESSSEEKVRPAAPVHEVDPSLPASRELPDPGLFDLSDASDGYDEMAHEDADASAHVGDERARALGVLGSLLGRDAVASRAAPPPAAHPPPLEDEEDERMSDGPEAPPSTEKAPSPVRVEQSGEEAPRQVPRKPTPHSFAPIARFDPRAGQPEPHTESGTELDAAPDAEPAQQPDTQPSALPAPAAEAAVHMESLKDMFQPSEEGGQFSLFGGADELDLGENPMEEAEEPLDPAPVEPTTAESATAAPLLPPLSDGAVIDAVREGEWTPFWRTASDAEIQERWHANRGELTQAYKRMHREALKKRKRRIVGSRAGAQRGEHGPARAMATVDLA